MKKLISLFSVTLLLCAVVFVGCKKDPGVPEIPMVPVTGITPLTGNLKLGTTITINGTGFDEALDILEIWVGDSVSSIIGSDMITFFDNKITFGIKPSTAEAGKTVDIKVSRETFTSLVIAKEVTLIVPTLAEGWIPNAQFKAKIRAQGGNPLFNTYDMIDVGAARTWTTTGNDVGTMLYMDEPIADYTGIELFKAIIQFRGWNNGLIETIDLTNTNIDEFHSFGCAKLKTLTLGPKCLYVNIIKCPSLKTFDTSVAPGLHSFGADQGTVLDVIDLRKPKALWPTAEHATYWDGDYIFGMSQGGTIKMSLFYYNAHWANDADHGWNCIYNNFTNNGCKVEIYDDTNSDTKLFDGTDAAGAHPILKYV